MPTLQGVGQVTQALLLLLSCHFLLVSSAVCTGSTCAQCVETQGCGWCGATQLCEPGNTTGPELGICLGSWQTSCPACSQQLTCIGCSANLNCAWCDTSNNPANPNNQCIDLHSANSSTCPKKYSNCPCNDYNTCHECAKVPGCTFCNTGTCQDAATNCPQVSCNCVNYPTCTTCNDDPSCGWCTGISNCTSLPAQCTLSTSCDAHCNMELSCLDCTAERGCGWCPITETCHSIDSTICGNALQTQCRKHCERVPDCNLCIDLGLPCEWCPTTHSCVDIEFATNCSTTDSCAVEVCPQAETCEICLQTPGCGWCTSGDYCTDIFSNKCSLARNCSGYFHGGFSLGSFFGGMATMLALYLLIGICAYFYKKKNPPAVHYQELREPQ